MKLEYDFSFPKLLAALLYMSRVPDFDKFRAVKMLYYADKYHLIRYARPIVGDIYCRAPYGPTPSSTLNFINSRPDARFSDEEVDQLVEAFELKGKSSPRLVPRVEPNLDVLSESDIEALDFAIKEYGYMPKDLLFKMAHDERSWKEAKGHWIEYELFFDPDDEGQTLVLEYAREIQEHQEMFSRLSDNAV